MLTATQDPAKGLWHVWDDSQDCYRGGSFDREAEALAYVTGFEDGREAAAEELIATLMSRA